MAEYAVPRYMRDSDGGIVVSYIDTNTLQPVTDTTGYAVIEPANIQVENIPYAEIPEGVQQVASPEEADVMEEEGTIPPRIDSGNLNASPAPTGMNERSRTVSNDFGYIDKPGWLGIAGKVPGMIGVAGKFANAVVNAENVKAVDKARSVLGLEPTSTMGQMKGLMSDNKGVVSESTNIGGTDYGIQMGGVMPDGRTALTPNEARTRAAVLDAPMAETTKANPEAESPRGYSLQPASEQVSKGFTAPPGIGPDTSKSKAKSVTPGKGLANLTSPESEAKAAASRAAPSAIGMDTAFSAGLSTAGIGPGRYAEPSNQITGRVQNVVGTTLGPGYGVSVTSGTYSDDQKAAIDAARNEAVSNAKAQGLSAAQQTAAGNKAAEKAGEVGSARHTTGLAMDFSVTDPQGNTVTDPGTLGQVAEALGAAGISGVGYGKGYMGAAIHADVANPSNPGAWGAAGKAKNMDPGLHGRVTAAQKESLGQLNTIAGYKDGVATPAQNPRATPAVDTPMAEMQNMAPTSMSFASQQTPSAATPEGMLSGYAIGTPDTSLSATKSQAVQDAYGAAYAAGLEGPQADVSVAQAMHESAYGTKPSGINNMHGIKGPGTMVATHEVENGVSTPTTASFANYASPTDSFAGWGKQMDRNWSGVMSATNTDDAIGQLSQGRLGAYATDPAYAGKISDMVDTTSKFSFDNAGPVSAKGIGTTPGSFANESTPDVSKGVESNFSAPGSFGSANPSGYSIGPGPSSSTSKSGAIGNTTSSVGVSGLGSVGGAAPAGSDVSGSTGTDAGTSSSTSDSSGTSGASSGSGGGSLGGFGGGYGASSSGASPGGKTGFGGMMGGASSSGSSSSSSGSSSSGSSKGGGFGGGYGGSGSGSGSANSGDNR